LNLTKYTIYFEKDERYKRELNLKKYQKDLKRTQEIEPLYKEKKKKREYSEV